MSTTTVHKTSVSIKKNNWDRLKEMKNKSTVINKALQIYFEREEYLQDAEEKFWDEKIKEGLESIEKMRGIYF